MVKFTRGDELISRIANKIREIIDLEGIWPQTPPPVLPTPAVGENGGEEGRTVYQTNYDTPASSKASEAETVVWDLDCGLEYLANMLKVHPANDVAQ
jgi:hypothetical protein